MQQFNKDKDNGQHPDEPEFVSVRLQDIAALAASVWKLNQGFIKEQGDGGQFSLRLRVPMMDIQKLIETLGITTVDLIGRPYDRGFAVTVVSYASDVSEESSDLVVVDMLSPIVMLKDRVLKVGEIVLGVKQ